VNPSPLVLLPSDLDASLILLDDAEFARLFAAVTREEARRRGKKPPSEPSSHEKVGAPTAPPSKRSSETITPAKANLIRAAMKAGVKPSAIARQFGLSNAAITDVLRSKER
jgi:DNA invertase Pin-like site-specific DNA recombinase